MIDEWCAVRVCEKGDVEEEWQLHTYMKENGTVLNFKERLQSLIMYCNLPDPV